MRTPISGFTATLDTSSLTDGPHSLVLKLHTNRGNVLTGAKEDFMLHSQNPYEIWIARNTPSTAALAKMREDAGALVSASHQYRDSALPDAFEFSGCLRAIGLRPDLSELATVHSR